MIELIIFDIDGVVTDGRVIIDAEGREQKQMSMQDVDGIFELQRNGFKIAAITGEDTDIVGYFEKRFPWTYFYRGSRTKSQAMEQIEKDTGINRERICYIGDGKYDVEPLLAAGLGVCPANAIDKAKAAADIILQNDGGKGCVWELLEILKEHNEEDSSINYFYKRLSEHELIFKKLASDQILMKDTMRMAEELCGLFNKGKQLFLFGNGGSAADAQHIATEFISRFYKDRPGLNAEALSVNTSTLTAIGNDFSFESVFARQLEAKANEGDFCIGITTGGFSKNVMEGLRYAKKKGLKTAILTGDHENPEHKDICDYIIKVPSKITPRIQEAHIFIGHTIAEYVEHRLFG